MRHTFRLIAALALVVASLFVLDGCGRKEKLTPPPGSYFPRQYPKQ